jgi:flavodoxin
MKLRGMIAYDSNYGNTKRVARALARGLEEGMEVDCIRIDEVDPKRLPEYDFIAVGGPTHMIRPSKPMKEFLGGLRDVDLEGVRGLSFDTRNESRMNGRGWLLLENSAARVIEGALRRLGAEIVRPRLSALVEGREGPLYEGVEERFTEVGAEIAAALR